MADLMDSIRKRRSIRAYESKEVPQKLLDEILEAARWAQSWANTQCWEIVVVKDKAIKEKIQDSVPGSNPGHNAVADAPILLVVCGKRDVSGSYGGKALTKLGDWFMFDLGVACQNIALAAHGLGLATVLLGAYDHEGVTKVLNFPDGIEPVALMPLGYAAQEGIVPPRKEVEAFVHYDGF